VAGIADGPGTEMICPAASACSYQDAGSSRVLAVASCFPAPWFPPWQMQWHSGPQAL